MCRDVQMEALTFWVLSVRRPSVRLVAPTIHYLQNEGFTFDASFFGRSDGIAILHLIFSRAATLSQRPV
jgi:hypothetical protein